MAPVFGQMWDQGLAPYFAGEVNLETAFDLTGRTSTRVYVRTY